MTHPSPHYELVTTPMGVLSIRDNDTMEVMHNPVGPWVEANSLYIVQSNLKTRLAQHLDQELVLFDVGLGAAANALATLHCAQALSIRRPLRLISYERNLNLLHFALKNAASFAHFEGYENAVERLLTTGEWQTENLTWQLRHGDFPEMIEHESYRAHIIFYDPYSFKWNSEMWLPSTFKKILSKCNPSEEEGAVLYTYTRATPIRVAMLMAGFYVGVGVASGPKPETTQASVYLKHLDQPLGKNWLERWQRSSNPNATGATDADFPAIQKFILNHRQF